MMREMAPEKWTPERRRQLTRDALLDAAAQLFAQRGFFGASLEEIAEAAGFTRGAIYSNFGSKEELLLAVMDRFIDQQFESIAENVAFDVDDPVSGAVSAGAWFKRTITLDLLPLELELRLSALRNPAARERLAAFDRRAGERAAQFIEHQFETQGAQLRIPARDMADIGRAAIMGLLQYAATDEEGADRYESLIESTFILIAAGAFEPGDDGDPSRPHPSS